MIYLASMEENEEKEVWDVIELNDAFYDPLLDDVDMVMPTEDVDSESGSQTGLQGGDA